MLGAVVTDGTPAAGGRRAHRGGAADGRPGPHGRRLAAAARAGRGGRRALPRDAHRLRRQGLHRAPAGRGRGARHGAAARRDAPTTSAPASPTASCSPTGPATPAPWTRTSRASASMLELERPLFGICLGHQLLARALGLETFKLRFGHRGANHPVLERETGRVLVTSQNHGFAVAMPDGPGGRRGHAHVALRRHRRGPAAARPARLVDAVPPRGRARAARRPRRAGGVRRPRRRGVAEGRLVPRRDDLRKIALIGSGPIVIGQACEFDYSGVQALRVLREEGYETVLVNSNPATIMTDPGLGRPHVHRAARPGRRRRACCAASGPTRCCRRWAARRRSTWPWSWTRPGVLDELGIELIGASVEAIATAEDRELLRGLHGERRPALRALRGRALRRRGARAGRRRDGAAAARDPPGLHARRPGRRLRGTRRGARRASSRAASRPRRSRRCWSRSRSRAGASSSSRSSATAWTTSIVVCSIENLDPMGVHTGDSVCVAPAMTLSDREFQTLRDAAATVIRAVGVETGGSNVQFALDRETGELVVIEMNPRVSRSSALASKATGYPIAKVATKLALGYTLDEIPNDLTGTTPASFEPTLDYVVVKAPRFAFEKFAGADERLTTHMKSVGEAMSHRPHVLRGVRQGHAQPRARHAAAPRRARSTCRCGIATTPSWRGSGAARSRRRSRRSPASTRGSSTSSPAWRTRSASWRGRAVDELDARRVAAAEAASAWPTPGWPAPSARTRARCARRGGRRACCRPTRPSTPAPPRSRRARPTATRPTTRVRAARRRPPGGAHPRLRPEPHRPGPGVRLLLRPRRADAARAGLRGGHGQLQPGDGLHRLRHLRPPVLRAADVRGRAGGRRGRAARRRRRAVRRPDAAAARAAADRGRRPDPRHAVRVHRPGRGPRALRPPAARPRPGGAGVGDGGRRRGRRARRARGRLPRAGAAELRARGPRDAHLLRRGAAARRQGGAAARSSTASSRTRSRSTSTRSPTARTCSSARSWSTSRRRACTRATRPA